MKFAIDSHIEVALDREYGDKIRAELDAYLKPENWYAMYGEDLVSHTDLAVPTAMTRPTLTTALNPTTSNKDD